MRSRSRGHLERAKSLRRECTDAETRLWSFLRRRQLCGFKFRRQVPIGDFVVDFYCPSKRLIVEVDGGHPGSAVVADLEDLSGYGEAHVRAPGLR